MCLSKMWDKKRVKKVNSRGPFIAYKVVLVWKDGHQLVGPYRTSTKFKMNRIMKRSGLLKRRYGPAYPAGFHVFASVEAAEKHFSSNRFRIIRCLVWDIAGAGYYSNSLSYIARKMVLMA